MSNTEFEAKLEELKLSKKDFAIIADLPYQTLQNWKSSDKTPAWVKSYLDFYKKAQSLEVIVNSLRVYL